MFYIMSFTMIKNFLNVVSIKSLLSDFILLSEVFPLYVWKFHNFWKDPFSPFIGNNLRTKWLLHLAFAMEASRVI